MMPEKTSPPIDFYFDFSSPYGYLAAHRIDAVAAEHGREVALPAPRDAPASRRNGRVGR